MKHEPALFRLLAIHAVRLAGVALVIFGVMVMAGRLDGPPLGGFALASAGLVCAAIFPVLLARRWRSPDK